MTDEMIDGLLRSAYGIKGTYKRFPSERDETFLVCSEGGQKFTLKIANPAENSTRIEFQTNALLHIAGVLPQVPVPRVVPHLNGGHCYSMATGDETRIVRLLTYLDGEQQYRTPSSTVQSYNLGKSLATLGQALRSFRGRLPEGKLLWDISHTLDLAELVKFVALERQTAVVAVLEDFATAFPAASAGLRRQIIHNDFNPHNVLVKADNPAEIVGIIDFGDMVYAPLVNDLAIAFSYHLGDTDWANFTGAIIRGFNSVEPLTALEKQVLPVLIKARLAMTVIITEWRASSLPENSAYILRNNPAAWMGLQRLSQLSSIDFHQLISSNCEA